MQIFRYIVILITIIFLGIVSSHFSYAYCDPTSMGDAGSYLKNCGGGTDGLKPDQGGDGVTSVKALVINIAKRVIEFGALFAIGAIVLSGVKYTTSYGDDEKVKKAKMTGTYAIIGLLLLLVAFPLVDIIVNFIYNLS
ncbi:hypothetical protein HOO68_04360 [Candidatus Gracilibacteria bacterium]|nr:hypothetical protein [Candidatus Gracilibacteria bacterium]